MTRATCTSLIQPFHGIRITIHSVNDFNSTLAKIYNEIGTPANLKYLAVAKNITAYDEASKEQFIAAITKVVGSHGFMLFLELDHGTWVPLFNVGSGLKLKRLILGNPWIAITMLEHDLIAGLSVPVELLVRGRVASDGGGTDLVYNLPSALIAVPSKGSIDEELLRATKELDTKFEDFVKFVAT